MCKLCDIRYILHVSELFLVNRFLALTKFEGEFGPVFQYECAMSVYDDFMVQKFAPGSSIVRTVGELAWHPGTIT